MATTILHQNRGCDSSAYQFGWLYAWSLMAQAQLRKRNGMLAWSMYAIEYELASDICAILYPLPIEGNLNLQADRRFVRGLANL